MTPTVDKLFRLLEGNSLTRQNADRCARIFYDVAKVIYERQKRLNKSQLKMKEIAAALVLVEFHHRNAFRFEASGKLAENFGPCPEDKALRYFEQCVIGDVIDQYGRKIVVDEAGIRSLYKDRQTGAHVVSSENYEEVRGKRLPWIRHVLGNSKAIYVVEELVKAKFRRTYLYAAIPSIPLKPKPSISYYLVVVVEDNNRNLKVKTAYDIADYNRFLHAIEKSKPFEKIS